VLLSVDILYLYVVNEVASNILQHFCNLN